MRFGRRLAEGRSTAYSGWMGGRSGRARGKRWWAELLLAAPALAGCGTDSCFVAATLIATPRGLRGIESLAPGDTVWSYDPVHGLVERTVEAVHRTRVRVICRVEAGGASLRGVTPSHPMYDAAAGRYTELRQLREESRLLVFRDASAQACAIDCIQIEEVAEPSFEVFNLTVEGPEHNYVADGVLVHNKSIFMADACGNILLEANESCDDGNRLDGDGCSGLCQLERPIVPPPEHCLAGVTFADPALERAVRKRIPGAPSALTLESLRSMSALHGDNEPITSLVGLECLTFLLGLELTNGQVQDLTPIAGLTNLTWLTLSFQSIEDLAPLSGLSALETLRLEGNQIADLAPLSPLTKLSDFNASNNVITDLAPLSSLTRLSKLDARNNQIDSVAALAPLPLLSDIWLSGNQISDTAALRSLPAVRLILDDNPLANLDHIAQMPNLTQLNIERTGQSDLGALVECTSLVNLSAVGNGVSDLAFVRALPNLSQLRFQDNLITDLGPLVQAPGVGGGDSIFLQGNPIDCAAQAQNVAALRKRAGFLGLDCD